MLKSIKTSRERLAAKLSGSVSSASCSSASSNEEATSRQPEMSDDFVHQSHGHVRMHGQRSGRVSWSSAGYQAKTPFGDLNIHQADKHHILAAVLTSQPSAQGGRYLQRMLAKELQSQIRQHGGDIKAALPASLRALNEAYRNLHPFNGPVLENVQAAIVYADLRSQVLHTASNSGCRVVVGRSLRDGGVHTVADVGRSSASSESASHDSAEASSRSSSVGEQEDEALQGMHFATVQLRPGIDTVIIGSVGLWQELPSHKALLRLRHYHEAAPSANGGNAAAHLTNFALHSVARRSSRLQDPRMRSLRSVGHLQSLWTGDRSGYKWSRRQPVRRRRGDVHGDLSAVVLRMDWEEVGASTPKSASLSKAASAKARISSLLPTPRRCSSLSSSSNSAASERAARHWDLVRMHFLEYPRQARAVTHAKWADLIDAALEQARGQCHRRRAAELLLRTGLFGSAAGGSPPASRTPSLGPWQPASWDSLAAARTATPAAAAAAAAADDGDEPLGQALLPGSRLPSGQRLVSPSDSGSAASSRASSGGLSSWQPAIPRTVSRRQLFVPPPPQEHLHGLQESPQKGGHDKISDEWLAYEQHLANKLSHQHLPIAA